MVNLTSNCPLKTSNIEIDEDILGKYIEALKGKTVRKIPTQVKIDFVEVPKWLIKLHKKSSLKLM